MSYLFEQKDAIYSVDEKPTKDNHFHLLNNHPQNYLINK